MSIDKLPDNLHDNKTLSEEDIDFVQWLNSLFHVENLWDYRLSMLIDKEDDESSYFFDDFNSRVNFWNNFLWCEIKIFSIEDDRLWWFKKISIDIYWWSNDLNIREHIINTIIPFLESKWFRLTLINPKIIKKLSQNDIDKYSNYLAWKDFSKFEDENLLKEMILFLENMVCQWFKKNEWIEEIQNKILDSGQDEHFSEILMLAWTMKVLEWAQIEALKSAYMRLQRYQNSTSQWMLLLTEQVLKNSQQEVTTKQVTQRTWWFLAWLFWLWWRHNNNVQQISTNSTNNTESYNENKQKSIIDIWLDYFISSDHIKFDNFINSKFTGKINWFVMFKHDWTLKWNLSILHKFTWNSFRWLLINEDLPSDHIEINFDWVNLKEFNWILNNIYDLLRFIEDNSDNNEEEQLQRFMDNIDSNGIDSETINLIDKFLRMWYKDNSLSYYTKIKSSDWYKSPRFMDKQYRELIRILSSYNTIFKEYLVLQLASEANSLKELNCILLEYWYNIWFLRDVIDKKIKKEVEELFSFEDIWTEVDLDSKMKTLKEIFWYHIKDFDEIIWNQIIYIIRWCKNKVDWINSSYPFEFNEDISSYLKWLLKKRKQLIIKKLSLIVRESDYVSRREKLNEFVDERLFWDETIKNNYMLFLQKFSMIQNSESSFEDHWYKLIWEIINEIINDNRVRNIIFITRDKKLWFLIDWVGWSYIDVNLDLLASWVLCWEIQFDISKIIKSFSKDKKTINKLIQLLLLWLEREEKYSISIDNMSLSKFKTFTEDLDKFRNILNNCKKETVDWDFVKGLENKIDWKDYNNTTLSILKTILIERWFYKNDQFSWLIKKLALIDIEFKKIHLKNIVSKVKKINTLKEILKRYKLSIDEIWDDIDESIKTELDESIKILFDTKKSNEEILRAKNIVGIIFDFYKSSYWIDLFEEITKVLNWNIDTISISTCYSCKLTTFINESIKKSVITRKNLLIEWLNAIIKSKNESERNNISDIFLEEFSWESKNDISKYFIWNLIKFLEEWGNIANISKDYFPWLDFKKYSWLRDIISQIRIEHRVSYNPIFTSDERDNLNRKIDDLIIKTSKKKWWGNIVDTSKDEKIIYENNNYINYIKKH